MIPHEQTARATTISIHALRKEGDGHPDASGAVRENISIHALRKEGDGLEKKPLKGGEFLSTPSVRRATSAEHINDGPQEHFYPRPP